MHCYDTVVDTAGLQPGARLQPGSTYLSLSDEPLPPILGARGIGVHEDGPGLAELVRFVDADVLRLHMGPTIPAARNPPLAYEVFQSGGLTGKVVIDF